VVEGVVKEVVEGVVKISIHPDLKKGGNDEQ
jgi:hypothetical protein